MRVDAVKLHLLSIPARTALEISYWVIGLDAGLVLRLWVLDFYKNPLTKDLCPYWLPHPTPLNKYPVLRTKFRLFPFLSPILRE